MSNNYLQFSFLLECPNVIVRDAIIAMHQLRCGEAGRPSTELEDEFMGAFDLEPAGNAAVHGRESVTLWIHADEYGDPHVCGLFLSDAFRKLWRDGRIAFAYSVSCSRMATDEFGGGATFVTARNVRTTSAYNEAIKWLSRKPRQVSSGTVERGKRAARKQDAGAASAS